MATIPANGHATTTARRPTASAPPPSLKTIADDLEDHTQELAALLSVQTGIRFEDILLPPEEGGWLGALLQKRLGELATDLRRDAQACGRLAKG